MCDIFLLHVYFHFLDFFIVRENRENHQNFIMFIIMHVDNNIPWILNQCLQQNEFPER